MTNPATRHRERHLEHYALITEDDHTIERVLVPQLQCMIAANESVLMIVGPRTAGIVRERLGPDANTLQWAPTDRFYQRLGFAYARLLRYVRDEHAQLNKVHLVTEPDLVTLPATPVDRAAAYLGFEAMANDVFAGYGCPITCIWNRRQHTAPVIDGIRRIHPREWTAQGAVDNSEFVAPHDYLKQRSQPSMTPIPSVTDIDLTVRELREVADCRAVIGRWAGEHHFMAAAVRQVAAAASEVITNGIQHGSPPVRLRAWRQDATLILQVDDHGGRAIPADAGYRPPTTPGDSTGLWVARQLADVLLTHSANGRSAVRMYFPYAVIHRHLEIPYLT
jgi:anti-sigma regulatory factor (Ser/Thr protein kinase)